MVNNSVNLNYSRNLIKGKITESIFEEMFRVAGEYTIIPLGYEHTTPLLAQYQHLVHVQKVLENIRTAPDFALVSKDKSNVFLVEVKYKSCFDNEDILKVAEELRTTWNPCFLFVASEKSFYYGSIQDIINKNGQIDELPDRRINKDIQNQYFSLIIQLLYFGF